MLAWGALTLAPPAPAAHAKAPTILVYGNYCGPGNKAPRPPIDALDAACARHDACVPDLRAGLATCACHVRLRSEAGAVARDRRASARAREAARFISDFAASLPCQ